VELIDDLCAGAGVQRGTGDDLAKVGGYAAGAGGKSQADHPAAVS